jgi:hypothetical protein
MFKGNQTPDPRHLEKWTESFVIKIVMLEMPGSEYPSTQAPPIGLANACLMTP